MSDAAPSTAAPSADAFARAAERLHAYLVTSHWRGGVLQGPDPGVRFNARYGRFLKSALPNLPWGDDLVYLQTQGYWILDNWLAARLLDLGDAADLAVRATDSVVELQTSGGFWPYPNPEWRGRIATVEGCFAAIGLLESYDTTGTPAYLDAALRWYEFLVNEIRFRAQPEAGQLSVNYFAHERPEGGGVPNNATLVLWLLARLARSSGDDSYLRHAPPLLNWLASVQLGTGELPYLIGSAGQRDRVHFLCYQYNAFEFMDLAAYLELTGDSTVLAVLEPLAGYLRGGLGQNGAAAYDCERREPEVLYYASAVACALGTAARLGLTTPHPPVEAAWRNLLARQRRDGGMAYHSRKNYRFLRDRRSYPRYLSMILHHLLREYGARARPAAALGQDRSRAAGRALR